MPPSQVYISTVMGERQPGVAARDEAIREAVAEGASLRTVADAVGLSHGGVARIVHRT